MCGSPIPRLVSAYFYCKKKPQDGLCATVALDANADDTDLYAFAEHWGDFGLRQFALAFVLPEELLANKVRPCALAWVLRGVHVCDAC